MTHVRFFFLFFPKVCQGPPGPVQAALDGWYGQFERLGDLDL